MKHSLALVVFAAALIAGGSAASAKATTWSDVNPCPDLPVVHDGVCSTADETAADSLLTTGSVSTKNNFVPYTGQGDVDGLTQPVAE
jgi:hypothetical protein